MCSLVLRFTLRSFRLTATKQEAAEDANIDHSVVFMKLHNLPYRSMKLVEV